MAVKKLVAATVIVGIVLAAYFGWKGIDSYIDLRKYQQQIKDIKVENIDLTQIQDGIYVGNAEVLWIAADVKVIVKAHKIESVDLIRHKNERGSGAEVIPERVVEAQSLQVDTVSGATNSSKVILKAIENALKNGLQQGGSEEN